ncbi:MAG: hypothetical protein EOP86_23890 [Verrucomicrobiaceae bacterium]|nr:MAG: hypothetical protein EOP86_23890 [Verrucomicrobiaceae bacterium]
MDWAAEKRKGNNLTKLSPTGCHPWARRNVNPGGGQFVSPGAPEGKIKRMKNPAFHSVNESSLIEKGILFCSGV